MYELINPDLIQHRADEWGGNEMVVEIINMLIGEYDDRIVLIEKAVKSRDFKGIKEEVHSIKSNLYFFVEKESGFGTKIQQLENKGRDADANDLDQLFDYFKANSELTMKELSQVIKEL